MSAEFLQKALKAAKSFSPHLSSALSREENLVLRLEQERPETLLKELLDSAFQECDRIEDTEALKTALRLLKRKTGLLIALCDLGGAWQLQEVTTALSDLADTCIRLALRHLLRRAHERGIIELDDFKEPEKNCGIMIAGVGKLGAHELNYSSDIDILVLYETAQIKMNDQDAIPAFCVKLTKELVRILDEKTADGYVFRTDLRLRPDPGSMPLAVSFKAAEIYYGSFGQNWERAAMIKARPIAGDQALARDFSSLMKAWIWRRSLDFATIQDIHSIKRQIDVKHGKKSNANDALSGFNVKLGHGGIREIEFFAQTQQLIYGGKTPDLRASKTLEALDALTRLEHITEKTARELSSAYIFLRTVEHRLQMIDDRQTHSLPDTSQEMEALAKFVGFTDAKDFTNALQTHLACVRKHYAGLFKESPSLADQGGSLVFTGTEDDPETIKTLAEMGFSAPSTVAATVRGWHHGRYRATRSNRARQILTELIPALLAHFCKTAHPDDAFLRFDNFLNHLPAGVPIFSMFQQNPELLALVAEIMGTSPSLAEHLGKHPQVLEGVLTRDFFSGLPDLAFLEKDIEQILSMALDYEDILDLTRKWARDRRFQAGIHILKALSPASGTGRYLADIAHAALTALLPHVKAEFRQQHGTFKTGDFGLIALGGFGSADMTVSSDLDLVAVYAPPLNEETSSGIKPLSPAQYYIRLTQRLLTALTAPTAEGKLYDVDLRLRPSGNDGPLAVSIESFIDYQKKNAWIWEHMCLLRGRVVAGSNEFKQKIDQGIITALTAPRDKKKLVADILSMRQKIETEYPAKTIWDVKYHTGGLIDIMFMTQYLVLRECNKMPDMLPARQIPVTLEKLAKSGFLGRKTAADLINCHYFLRGIEQFLTLAAEKPFVPASAPAALKKALALSVAGHDDFNALEKTLKEKLAFVEEQSKSIFY